MALWRDALLSGEDRSRFGSLPCEVGEGWGGVGPLPCAEASA